MFKKNQGLRGWPKIGHRAVTASRRLSLEGSVLPAECLVFILLVMRVGIWNLRLYFPHPIHLHSISNWIIYIYISTHTNQITPQHSASSILRAMFNRGAELRFSLVSPQKNLRSYPTCVSNITPASWLLKLPSPQHRPWKPKRQVVFYPLAGSDGWVKTLAGSMSQSPP